MTPLIFDCHNHLGVDLFFYLNGYHPYAQDLPTLVTEGRHCRVDRWVVFPMVSNLSFDVPAMRRAKLVTGGCEAVPYAFENERMLREIYELYPDLGRYTLPFAILDPTREPAAQVRRLRELHREFPFHGLKIQPTIIQSEIRSLLTVGRGFVDLAAELDLPFLIHSSVAPDDVWSQASDILDVAAANPHVRFCLFLSLRPRLSRPRRRTAQHVVRLLRPPDSLRGRAARPPLRGAGGAPLPGRLPRSDGGARGDGGGISEEADLGFGHPLPELRGQGRRLDDRHLDSAGQRLAGRH